jgi:two-component system LytT family response regulator
MTPWKVVIVEDEVIAARRLRRLLESDPEIEIVGEAADATNAAQAIEAHRPDILFLDIQIPGINGIQLVRQLPPEQLPSIVFVTAFEQYAVQAFEAQAVDYLLKPVSETRLATALTRAKAAASGSRSEMSRILRMLDQMNSGRESQREKLPRSGAAPLERLLVKVDGTTVVMPVGEIDWVESSANYVKLHIGNQVIQYRQTLSSLVGELDPARFARIHRSTIVNLERIREIQPWFSGDGMVILRNGSKLRMSRSYRRDVERRLGR